MRVVFTGGTSFSGTWFIQELATSGNEVFALVNKKREDYNGLRKSRLELCEKQARCTFAVPFGSDDFMKALIELPPFDLFCHHAADVTDYKSADFNVAGALEDNTRNLQKIFDAIKKKGCSTLILTGSVFEPGEGAGSDDLRAVSPYGLSKGLTSSFFKYYAEQSGIFLKKFVIPNPFGPFEEIRFTTFLARTWLKGEIAPVTMPSYVRDNIPVSLLAKAYVEFAQNNETKVNPSGYVESQGAFTLRFQSEMQKRLHLPCQVDLKKQTHFPEPRVRINTDLLDLDWDESQSWDDLAEFYLRTYGNG